ncbi:tRNA-specific adenosine deaminase [Neobacillus rhizosphaerae]|uniref:tRNA-specific adenosine deaminase n=1 Tax=Neobacillus rhizosphaerae TaxID=2880965 RepID=A0ABN8KWE0_9BACI|nr:nucleoside deaminase [Neobacillus rhizosphaerae]CAH2716942.1 tRNA-specific adenosine deaminase [Neobacillus rhizosphaerae]
MLTNFHDYEHHFFMQEALKEAEEAGKRDDRPIGAVIIHNGTIISRGSNRINTMDSELEHAEINAMNHCASYLRKHARECILYTTVEPCMMCLSTLIMANIRNVVFAVEDKYLDIAHFIDSNTYIKKRLHNYLGGVLAEESAQILKTYSPFMAEVVLNGRRPS